MREKEVFLEDLQKQTSAVYQRQREAIDANIPDLSLVSRLAREMELRMIAGLPL